MNEFDSEARARLLWRLLAIVLSMAAVIGLIGLTLGRPSGSDEAIVVGTPGTIAPLAGRATFAPTTPPAPSPTLAPTNVAPSASPPVATLAPDVGWKDLSREQFDSATTWPAKEDQGWASGYEAGRYWLKLDGQRTLSYSVPIAAPEFRVAVDVQVKSGRAGLLFLSDDPNIVYRFLIDNAGSYRLERQQASSTTALRDWTASAALRQGPEAANRIMAQRVEDEVTLFANDVELMRFSLAGATAASGRAGMTIDAVARDAGALAYFDNLVVQVPLVSAQ